MKLSVSQEWILRMAALEEDCGDVSCGSWDQEGWMTIDAIGRDARSAYTLYATMRTEELLQLRAAFEADTSASDKPETIAFGAGRIALIDHLLASRRTQP